VQRRGEKDFEWSDKHIQLLQIRTVDQRGFRNAYGSLWPDVMTKIDKALVAHLGLN